MIADIGSAPIDITRIDRINFAGTYQHTKLDHLVTIDNRIYPTAEENFENLAGNQLPHAPHFSMTATYEHDFLLPNEGRLTPRFTVHYETRSWLSYFNGDVASRYAPGDQAGKGLLGTTLRYPYELRDESQFFDDIKSPKITKDMVQLAGHILQTKAGHFDPDQFKDEYENALKALVKRKASGKKIELPEPEERPSNVVSLMDALKQSLKGSSGKKTSTKAHARRTTGRRRAAKT